MQQNQPITSINTVLDYRFVCFRWCQYVNMIRVYISMFHVRLLNTVATMIMISGLSSTFNLFEQFCKFIYKLYKFPPVWSVCYIEHKIHTMSIPVLTNAGE